VWAHGVEIEIEETKKWICCMYWNEVFKGGGIHRLKLHLAREKGEVKKYSKVSAVVRYAMQRSVENFNERKRKYEEDTNLVRGGADGDDCVKYHHNRLLLPLESLELKKEKLVHQTSQQQTGQQTYSFYLEANQVINKPQRVLCNLKKPLKVLILI
jgi:hypothetical protein